MGAITYFEELLRGSDWGEPTDREQTGFYVEILEFNGFAHIRMRPVGQPEEKTYVALLSLEEGRRFVDGMAGLLDRVEPLGQR